MSRKKKELPLFENITITGVAGEGKAIAKTDDKVIFVPFAAPGDVVDLQVTRKKHSYMEARIVRFEKKSEQRVEPFCSHFGTCGGCKWQHLPYETQLQFKRQQVIDCLERIAKVELPEIRPTLGSAKTTFYRNKLEFSFSNKRWIPFDEMQDGFEGKQMNGLGFHIPNLFDKVLDIDKCYLQSDFSNKIRLESKRFALEQGYTFFDLRNKGGLMRNMFIRSSSNGELMVIYVFYEDKMQEINNFLKHMGDIFPEITSLLFIINEKCNDTITDQKVMTFKGKDHIMEEMEGLQFKVGPKSFYQTNSLQAYELYKTARTFANLTGNELVYDLYTGTGTIANFVSKQARQVIGLEYVPEAIEDAKMNAQLNDLTNTLFYAGDMKDILTLPFIEKHGKPDVIITDPPRAGMHADVIKAILFAAPRTIVYVSCNPATQARDIALLDADYKVTAVQPVDMFPHTQHVENVVQLTRRKK